MRVKYDTGIEKFHLSRKNKTLNYTMRLALSLVCTTKL